MAGSSRPERSVRNGDGNRRLTPEKGSQVRESRSQKQQLLIQQSSEAMQHLGWSDHDGKKYLEQTYGKSSRQLLSEEELAEFCRYLNQIA